MQTLIVLKYFSIIPEFFLGLSIIYLILHGTFVSTKQHNNLITESIIYVSLLILLFSCLLCLNNSLSISLGSIYIFNSIINDSISELSKLSIIVLSFICFCLYLQYVPFQKINQFEYLIILLISILGLVILCSSNDIIVAYLAIELQSLSFYILAAFKQKSAFSVESGLKYFILGAIASSLFLFGFSLIYGVTGCLQLEDISTVISSEEPSLNFSHIHFSLLNLENRIKFDWIVRIYCWIYLLDVVTRTMCEIDSSVLTIFTSVLFRSLSINSFLNINLQAETLCYYAFWYQDTSNLDNYFQGLGIEYANFNKMWPGLFANVAVFDQLWLTSRVNFIDSTESLVFNHYLFIINISVILILCSLFFKLAVVPFQLWLPDIYENSPSSSTAFFAIIPKIAILVFIYRFIFASMLDQDQVVWMFIILGSFSILYGSIIALEERKLKSLIAYSAISNIGYILIASFETSESNSTVFCYMLIYMLASVCLWSIFMLVNIQKTSKINKYNKELSNFSSFFTSNPIISIFFSMILFSIAGIPPFIGFLVKFGIFSVSMSASLYLISLISILSSVIATFYYLRIIKIIYFEKIDNKILYLPINFSYTFIINILFSLLIFLFVYPEILYLIVFKIDSIL